MSPVDEGINPGWWVVAGGASLLTAGLICDLTQAHLIDDKQAAYDRGDVDEFNRMDEKIERARTVDYVLYGAGGAAVVVGAALLLVEVFKSKEADVPIEAALLDRGGLISYRVAF